MDNSGRLLIPHSIIGGALMLKLFDIQDDKRSSFPLASPFRCENGGSEEEEERERWRRKQGE